MTESEIGAYLREHPKALAVVRSAVQEEDIHAGEPHYLGWEWYQVRAYPASLMKLVIDGVIRVNFKSNSSTCYLLVDPAAVKEVVAGYQ